LQFRLPEQFGRVTSLKHSPTALNVSIEVSKVKAPWTSAAAVLDVWNQPFLDEIAQLLLANRQIFGGSFRPHEAWRDGNFLWRFIHVPR
jgi:hypothetical protein